MSVRQGFRSFFRSTSALHVLMILVCVGGAYSTSLTGGFIWDDYDLVVNNEFLRSASGFREVFLHDIAAGIGEQYFYYRPLHMLTYWVEYRLWGLWAPGYRMVNLILHIGVCLLLYRLVRGVAASSWAGLCAALLYGLHPIHTGAISYIAGRADPLAGLFILTAILCHRHAMDAGRAGWFWVSMSAYIAALLSREHAVVFLGVMGAYHIAARKRGGVQWLVIYLAITVGYGILRKTLFPELVVDLHLDALPQRIPVFFVAFARYLRILIWPHPLQVDYGVIYFPWSDPRAILGMVLAGSFLLTAGYLLWRRSMIGWGLSWYLVSLLPFSNFYPLNAYMAEHWLYLPWMGLSFGIAIGARRLWERKTGRPVFVMLTSLLLVGLGVTTVVQNRVWRQAIPFYKHMLGFSPDSVILYNRLGIALLERERWSEAARAYERALQIDPGYAPALHNLAVLHEQTGWDAYAFDLYVQAVQARPSQCKSWEHLIALVTRHQDPDLIQAFTLVSHDIHPRPQCLEVWVRTLSRDE